MTTYNDDNLWYIELTEDQLETFEVAAKARRITVEDLFGTLLGILGDDSTLVENVLDDGA